MEVLAATRFMEVGNPPYICDLVFSFLFNKRQAQWILNIMVFVSIQETKEKHPGCHITIQNVIKHSTPQHTYYSLVTDFLLPWLFLHQVRQIFLYLITSQAHLAKLTCFLSFICSPDCRCVRIKLNIKCCIY